MPGDTGAPQRRGEGRPGWLALRASAERGPENDGELIGRTVTTFAVAVALFIARVAGSARGEYPGDNECLLRFERQARARETPTEQGGVPAGVRCGRPVEPGGRVPVGEVPVDAPAQDFGDAVGGAEFALAGDGGEQPRELPAGGFGVVQSAYQRASCGVRCQLKPGTFTKYEYRRVPVPAVGELVGGVQVTGYQRGE